MVAVVAHPAWSPQRHRHLPQHRHPRHQHPPLHLRHPPPLAVKLASFGETSPERPPAAKAGQPKAEANVVAEAVVVASAVAAVVVVPVAVDRSFRAACSSASRRCPLTSRRSSWPE